MWVFPKIVGKNTKWMVKIMENPMNKWMIWGFSHIFGNTHVHTTNFLILPPQICSGRLSVTWEGGHMPAAVSERQTVRQERCKPRFSSFLTLKPPKASKSAKNQIQLSVFSCFPYVSLVFHLFPYVSLGVSLFFLYDLC